MGVASSKLFRPSQRAIGWISALALPLLLGLTGMVFWPGLTGPFLMDDLVHLPKLAQGGGVNSLESALKFIFSGSSATGRPLSYASFLINDNAWPTDPWSFKYTNLLIHLLNSVLVFTLAQTLAGILLPEGRANRESIRNWIGLATMVVWVLHPMHLSPVMLVIQRMTLLMALFTLVGLILYLRGRLRVVEKPTQGYVLMSFGVGGFGALAALAKDPGVMLVCYILALETTLLKARLPHPVGPWKLWFSIFVLLPLVGVAGYFLSILPRIDELYLQREFTMVERLLTEARVLFEYVSNIVLPSISNSGPYRDAYVVSRGLLEPMTTLPSVVFAVGLLVLAWIRRRKNPLGAFVVLWFFLAHSLESTILPLELYFEHRNYLPMLGIFFALAYGAFQLEPTRIRRVAILGLAAFVAIEGGITYASSRVWGDARKLSLVWASERPESVRTRFEQLHFWLAMGDYGKVERLIEAYTARRGDDASLIAFRFFVESCFKGATASMNGSLDRLREVAPRARFEFASLEAIRALVGRLGRENCTHTADQVIAIIDLYLSNQKFSRNSLTREGLFQAKAKIYRRLGDLDKTIAALEETFAASDRYQYRIEQAILLASAGLYSEALEFIDEAREAPRQSVFEPLWRDREIERSEAAIRYWQKHEGSVRPEGQGSVGNVRAPSPTDKRK